MTMIIPDIERTPSEQNSDLFSFEAWWNGEKDWAPFSHSPKALESQKKHDEITEQRGAEIAISGLSNRSE